MTTDLSEISLQLAGRVGAAGLSASAGTPGLLAAVDQHAADVRDALGRESPPAAGILLAYARGFVESAIGRGWCPPSGTGPDWESVRLTAVCQLLAECPGSRR